MNPGNIFHCMSFLLIDRPEPPQEVEISSCGPKRVELIWRDGWDGGEPIKEYLIQYNTSDNAFYWNSADEEVEYLDMSSKTAFISLSPWGWYSFRVLAKNSLGYSDPSKPTKKECNTPPERPTSNPVNVRTKTDKEGKLIITWDVSLWGEGGGWDVSLWGEGGGKLLGMLPLVSFFSVMDKVP